MAAPNLSTVHVEPGSNPNGVLFFPSYKSQIDSTDMVQVSQVSFFSFFLYCRRTLGIYGYAMSAHSFGVDGAQRRCVLKNFLLTTTFATRSVNKCNSAAGRLFDFVQ